MSKNLKRWMAGEYRASLGGSDRCVVVACKTLGGETSARLRSRLRARGVGIEVLRNRVAAHALSGTALESVAPLIKGTVAVATGGEDSIDLAKSLVEGVKGEEGLELRGGLLDGRVVGGDEVRAMAALPSKAELLGLIASLVVEPITGVARGVDAVLTGVARAVDAVRVQKEKEAGA